MGATQRQKQRVLTYLETGRALDPIKALTELGVYRLSARIYDLRNEGHDIANTSKKVRNRWGEECTVASYRLRRNGRFVETQAHVSQQDQMDWVEATA